jgi:brefeldin A-resistance guanine nucleotide exchange factor 1
MHTLVRIVFSKLYTLDPDEEEEKLLVVLDDDVNEGELRMSVTTKEETLVEEDLPSNKYDDLIEHRGKSAIVEEEQPRSPLSPINRPECTFLLPIISPNF